MAEPSDTPVLPLPSQWDGGRPTHRYLVCDVFAERPLEGNQLGVFLDGRPISGDDMQRIARELNIAETVFLLPPREAGDVAMRIFTPSLELPFAGHPVLGTAFVVAVALRKDEVRLETGAGVVPVSLEWVDDRPRFGLMSQPIPTFEAFGPVEPLLLALRVEHSELPVEIYRNGPQHVFVTLPSPEDVARLRPDLGALNELGVAANCIAGAGRHWKTRMFYPAAGVAEDPATGSAAGPLAVHLARHGRIGFGEQVEIRQGEEIGRPSRLWATAEGDKDLITSVRVGGHAHVVAEGRLRIDAA